MNNTESWEEEFFNRFGADKIWVKPFKENVETILDIHSFIHQVEEKAYSKGIKFGMADANKMAEANHELGRQSTLREILEMVEGEICTTDHSKEIQKDTGIFCKGQNMVRRNILSKLKEKLQ